MYCRRQTSISAAAAWVRVKRLVSGPMAIVVPRFLEWVGLFPNIGAAAPRINSLLRPLVLPTRPRLFVAQQGRGAPAERPERADEAEGEGERGAEQRRRGDDA